MKDLQTEAEKKPFAAAVKALWIEMFEDKESYVDHYMSSTWKHNRVLLLLRGEEIVSMLHLNPYTCIVQGERLDLHYIVGVCTKKAEQGKLGFLSGKIAEFVAAEVPEQENVDNLNAPDRGEIGSGMNGKLFPPGRITGIRSLPCQYKEILTFARKRNPMNHMAVMMRRSAVLAVGNYHPVPGAEDYELWVRLLQAGYKAENLSDILVYARTDNGMIKRRGGLSYARAALNLQKTFFKSGFLNRREYLRNCVIRVTASLIPASVRGILYQKKLRGTLSEDA